ncbi:hypothetical protein RAK27_11380 [Carnobacterium maltaromaticum]|uniref:Uncharacterized protein n=1 Tax=Carnobacterium maltaromaticum TaxID=2751 RepID=A0AAW9JUJ0_CARML|nr:hypothetical protein [Carnobacterium maltaromaticum]MDZ5759263.1 hypothetical protein [Carnobacterium maltaromaticum]
MRIEDKWLDGFMYYIEFEVEVQNTRKLVRKSIILHEELKKEEVFRMIQKNFAHVKKINWIDYYDEVLLDKGVFKNS